MKKKSFLGLSMLLFSVGFSANAADYGLASNPQDGNILHCFNWKLSDIKAELPNIAAAGFTSVQTSPLQGNAGSGAEWYYAYQPYDFAIASSGMGTKSDLQALCTEADKYGIKVIVDVVANHLNGSMDYVASKWRDDQYWHTHGGSIDYCNRWQVTHGEIGMRDLNSEHSTVANAVKAYIEELKSCGVDGIRWDAAKHISLPSESCNFWSTVTSVSGMWHYGEILEGPTDCGGTDGLMVEYTKYISVTDNAYCRGMRNNINSGNVNSGYGNWNTKGVADNKLVYWAESHDEYSNDGEYGTNTAYVSVDKINRTYAMVASRNGASALYFSRPSATSKNSIKVGQKGQLHFKQTEVAAVNKFRNAMVGKADYYVAGSNAMAVCRKDGGAVIVMPNGSGNVSIQNGGGYVPAGSYKDIVSGNTFTVTSSTISGSVGSTGIAVIMVDGVTPTPTPDPTPTPTPGATVTITGDYNIAYSGDKVNVHYWGGSSPSTWPGVTMTTVTGSDGNTYKVAKIDATSTGCLFNTDGDSNKTGDLTYSGTYIMDDNGTTSTAVVFQNGSTPTPDPTPTPSTLTIYGDYNIAYNGDKVNVHYWGGSSPSTWPGVTMTTATGSDGNTYKVAKIDATSTGCLFNTDGDSNKTGDLTYSGSYVMSDNGVTSTAVIFQNGSSPTPTPTPDPSTGYTVYFDNSGSNWSTVYCYAWTTGASDQNGAWPGVAMTALGNNVYSYTSTTEPANVIFNNGSTQTDDLAWVTGHIYKADGSHSEYQDNTEVAPTVTISPNGGTVKGTSNITVTIAGEPTSITADFNGTSVTLANGSNTIAVSSYLNDGQTGTLTISATNAYGTTSAEATFTRSDESTPTPTPTGNSLNTDYYKTNPNGKVGTRKTINMSFSNQKATNALSNWSDAELIAQGVARDVCQAFRGNHEYPIVDSYAMFAAYDSENLYLGIQYVYEVWGYGEGGYAKKLGGESKPYNNDGRLMIAFDLDPDKSFDGYINGTGAIWNDEGAPGAKFNNGVDAVWIGSTKPGVGTPGFFIPTADGHASYDAAYCKTSTVTYGYADGLLSCISEIYGQSDFGYDASLLEGNAGFVDLSNEVDDSDHTFYEFKIPLSLLGVTEDYIKNYGIGVQCLDFLGSSPHGGLPYDPAYFDNVTEAYTPDESSSKEKEDEDVLTYSLARIGKTALSGITDVVSNGDESLNIYAIDGVLYIDAEEDAIVTIVSADGRMIQQEVSAGRNVIDDLNRGFYIVNRTKVIL